MFGDVHRPIFHLRTTWWAIWCCIGLSIVLVVHFMGILDLWNGQLLVHLSMPPVNLEPGYYELPPIPRFFLTAGSTLCAVQFLIRMKKMLERLLFLLSVLFLQAMLAPIAAIFNAFFSPYGMLLSMLVAGLGAAITAYYIPHPEQRDEAA